MPNRVGNAMRDIEGTKTATWGLARPPWLGWQSCRTGCLALRNASTEAPGSNEGPPGTTVHVPTFRNPRRVLASRGPGIRAVEGGPVTGFRPGRAVIPSLATASSNRDLLRATVSGKGGADLTESPRRQKRHWTGDVATPGIGCAIEFRGGDPPAKPPKASRERDE